MKKKGIISVVLAACMLLSSIAATGFTSNAVTTEVKESSADYGLAKNIQDGVILHCFDWKYSDIKAELPNIAKAGFTSVQTSPAQPDGSGAWYWLYQPTAFCVGNNGLGSKSELQSLCSEAKKYGIKVVVDVVANHLNGDHGRIQNDLRDSQFWHNQGSVGDWNNRYQVTHGDIGMADLNTEHSYVQQVVTNYVKELKSIGVEGIRWDAAKHIGLPSEGDNFWKAVTSQGLYNYGEILDGPGGDAGSVLKEYANYISFTDSGYGWTLANAFRSGNAPSAGGNWSNLGVNPNRLVYWAESHDTWSNDSEGTKNHSQNVIDRAYAVAASRSGATALYFSRPSSSNKDDIKIGQKGSTHFTSPEVAAVNHFHNAMVGQKEYYTSSDGCAVTCREQGAVIVKGQGSGNVSVQNGGGLTAPGTYKDEITGNTFTVTNSTISGNVGSSGIAVIYKSTPKPSTTISQQGGKFKSDTLTLTIGLENAKSGTYQIDNGSKQSYTGTTKITIGNGVPYGSTITVKLTATGEGGTSEATYTFKKVDPNAVRIIDFSNSNTVYLWNTSKWDNPNCYSWMGDSGSVQWPGGTMTKVDNFGGFDLYKYTVQQGETKIIFSNNGGNQSDDLTLPTDTVVFDNGKGQWVKADTIDEDVAVSKTPATQPTTAPPTTQPTTAPPTNRPTNPTTQPPTQATTSQSKVLRYGDANCDYKINISDVTIIQKNLAGLSILSAQGLILALVNDSSTVSIKDATAIQKYILGMNTNIGKAGQIYGSTPQPTTAPPTQPTTARPTQPTTAPPTQPTTAKPSGKITIYFTKPNGNDNWSEGTPVARCFENDYNNHQDFTMQQSGDKYSVSVDSKFKKVEFRSGNGQTWTSWYDIHDGTTYSG